jgi:hypothetical protein
MPKMIVQHEPWCAVHDDGIGEELCASNTYDFGPPAQNDLEECEGYIYVARAESDEKTHAVIYFPTAEPVTDATLTTGAVRQIAAALEHDSQQLLNALHELIADIDKEAAS